MNGPAVAPPAIGTLCRPADLHASQVEEMLALMNRYYRAVSRETFLDDLAEKAQVILLSDGHDGTVVGFSTLTVIDVVEGDQAARVLFSGDTIVERRFWHANPLAALWGRRVLELVDENPGERLYWLLLSKGFRTYRYLPVFFRHFYPRHDADTPAALGALLATVASARYGARYDAATGIVHAGHYHLRAGMAELANRASRDPHVAYFVARNPGFVVGDELCCLAPLSRGNFRSAAYRVMAKASRTLPPSTP